MTDYQKPGDVKAPRRSLGHLVVIYDGGPQPEWDDEGNLVPEPEGSPWAGIPVDMRGFSVAEYELDEEPRMGMRWNGRGGVGMPHVRGVPIWFAIPIPFEAAIRAAVAEILAKRQAA